MKKVRCFKCGGVLDPTTPEYSGKPPSEAAKLLTSDHASKNGCDWAAANVQKVAQAIGK